MRISDWSSDVCSSDLLDAWDWPAHRSLLGDAELLVKLQRPGNDRAAEFSGAIGPDGDDPVPLQQLVFEFARDRGAAAVEIFDAGQIFCRNIGIHHHLRHCGRAADEAWPMPSFVSVI